MTQQRERFVRREYYFVLLSVAVVALAAGMAFAELASSASLFDRVLLPSMAAVLMGLGIVLWRFPARLRTVEIAIFASVGVFLLIRLAFAMYVLGPGTPVPVELGEFAFWFPAFYGFAFLVFGIDIGKRVAIGYFFVSLIGAVPYLPGALTDPASIPTLYALTQLFLSSATMIFILAVLGERLLRFADVASTMTSMAHTDPLTKLMNRRALMAALSDEIARARRYGTEVSLLLIDLDRFKRVNDRYGHAAGDAVLETFGELLLEQSRDIDVVGRWGGEEFLVVLPEADQEVARQAASRLRRVIESHDFAGVDRVTVSIGVATFAPEDTLDALVNRADKALYAAKDRGRNRVEVAAHPGA